MDFNLKIFLINFNEGFTFFLIFPSIILFGLYLTFKLQFVQISKLKMSFSCLLKKDQECQGNISHYQAISAVLAGNFGTGNISGMAVAISTGGPGALVWMWIMAFLGASIQYVSCVLGVKYRKLNSNGEYVGGPMYYLSEGLNMKVLGTLFSLFTIFGALTVGNFAQINSATLPLIKLGLDPFICSLFIALFVGLVLVGGVQRVAKLASIIVPIKAVLYLGTAFVILWLHADQVMPAFELMIKAAFVPQSAFGGVLGFSVVKAISTGFDRGVFATDAGTGIVPILQSSARTTNPIVDGVVTLVASFLVMIVCTATGLTLIVTGAWQVEGLQSTNMVTHAFQVGLGSSIGAFIVITALILFAYTTILAWAYCAEKAVDFLWGSKYAGYFKYIYIVFIPIGALIHVDLIWRLADIAISLMLFTNLIGIISLSKEVIDDNRLFFLKKSDYLSHTNLMPTTPNE
ncbi:putative transporter [Candidatus Protochlamydia amoebophila]|uniref:alanine/glycine:cation symporter family protein n=1 Tax=Candidatus Protochlamydia amoebophila TaxID=362787 RepID=UPI001BC8D8D4|nr:amino acid carrier protein [Candidatus Protochlamydia amoebophila]MBS4163913.1 putative transporter [Candidatus Protochlamydia amoebophila]